LVQLKISSNVNTNKKHRISYPSLMRRKQSTVLLRNLLNFRELPPAAAHKTPMMWQFGTYSSCYPNGVLLCPLV
ncbi:unnamed protein product, partial [Sphagnum balticum]